MRFRRLNRRGVAGFFEEIPAAATAIVALLLFFSALVAGLSNLYTRQSSSNFSAEAETFLEGLLGYQNLTYQDQAGVYNVQTYDVPGGGALALANITYNFHPEFQYSIAIDDISTYAVHYDGSVQTSTPPSTTNGLQQGWVRDSTTVDLWVPNFPFDEYHAATLTVEIWS